MADLHPCELCGSECPSMREFHRDDGGSLLDGQQWSMCSGCDPALERLDDDDNPWFCESVFVTRGPRRGRRVGEAIIIKSPTARVAALDGEEGE